MLRILFMLVVVACLAKEGYGYFSIIGPSSIQPESTYSVSIISDASTLAASVLLTIANDKNFKTSQTITIQPGTNQVVNFDIGSLEAGEYNFTAVGVGESGLELKNNVTTLTLQTKTKSTFIQTDKAMYKPGDKVQFRVIVVDRDLNPAKIKNMDIFIKDASQNRVEQWLNVKTTMGVYTGELQLASTPCLGDWSINVNVDNEPADKTFQIAEYVLPKFEVTVSAPTDATYSDKSLIIDVEALYTYGENVKGVAQVTISTPSYPWMESKSPAIAQKQVDIDGKAYVEFQISELNTNGQTYDAVYEIDATVTEALTGVVLNGSTTVTIRQYKFTVTNLNNGNNYTPGPYTLKLQFAKYDGSPYVDTVSPIRVSYSNNYDQTNLTSATSGNMDSNGVATLNFILPESDNAIYIFANFKDYSGQVGYVYKYQAPTVDENSLLVRLINQNTQIGDDISIEITSANDLSSLNYLLTGRGNLILSDIQEVDNQKSTTINFKASFAMVPTAQFVVYYISSNGDIISGGVQISVSGLNNFVTIKTSADEKQPGENVDITISTKPLSQVCLLGIDQSVALLKTGNDIQNSDVYSQLGLYTTTGGGGPTGDGGGGPFPVFLPGPVMLDDHVALEEEAPVDVAADEVESRKKRSIWFPPYGGGWQDFTNAGLFVMTNCSEKQILYYPMIRKGGAIPMMALEKADAPMEPSAPSAPNVQTAIRKYFPETWIWGCKDASSGSLTLNEKAPDTITSWYLTGFATNDEYGLAVTDDKTVFKVFKKFFVSLNLPYSVKRGEAVLLQIVIFNYLPQNVTAKVTLDNSLKEFEFIDAHTQALKDKGCPPSIESSRTKTVKVNSNDGASLSFLITPLITGSMTIKVSANSNVAADAMQVPLLVIPEGVTQYKNKAQFVDLRSVKKFTADLTVDVPKDAVPDSTKVQISAIGDIMGPAVQNIDNLIQMPCGCGEQTMLGLAPDVVIFIYLKQAGLLTAALETKLLNYMKQGYQGELSYRHSDYSFSAFGNSDASGSTWLTAFVIRIFIQASTFISVDSTVITNSLAWLISQQQSDGHFVEPGNVIHTDMQGLAAKGVALTAYTLVTFLVNEDYAKTYADVISKGLAYVDATLKESGYADMYSLAIAAYAAQLADYEQKDLYLEKLEEMATIKGDQKYWEKVQLTTPTDPYCQTPSVNIEISGYVMLALIAAERTLDALPIMKWILAQQSATGGFGSTQNTVVGITALATLAAEISGSNVMSCSFEYGKSSTINIDKTNSLVLQSVELPSTTQSVAVTCTGSGFSLVQLSYQFNLNYEEISPRFVLDVEIDKSSNDYSLVLNICTSYIADDDGDISNMALVEVELPTGFTADLQTITDSLSAVKGFKKVETKNGNTVVVIYLDNVSTTQICFQTTAYQLCQIADEKPVSVIIQDYYRNDRRKTTFYSRTPKDVCSICDDDECRSACTKPAKDIKCPKKPSKGNNDDIKDLLKLLQGWLDKVLKLVSSPFC